MKDYVTKKNSNLEALIARYKEPEPTADPEPNHQASVTFVDTGGKPIPKPIVQDEPRVAVNEEPSDGFTSAERWISARISSTAVCSIWLWSMATGAAYVAKGPSVIGPSVSAFIGLWILCAFVASVQKHGG